MLWMARVAVRSLYACMISESTIDRGKEPKAGLYSRASSKGEQIRFPKSVLAHRTARAMMTDNGDK